MWHRLVKSQSSSDFFEELHESEKRSVENWRQRRATLLQDKMRQEMEARLEEHEELFCQSSPFIRVRVQGLGTRPFDPRDAEAILTVWNPSSDQLKAIKEGAVLRMKSLAVRDRKYEGLLQLSANARTSMATISEQLPLSEISNYLSHSGRSFARVSRILVLSKQMLIATERERSLPEVDVIGIVLKVEQRSDAAGWTAHVTDDTGLVLRVQSDLEQRGHNPFTTLAASARENVDQPLLIVALRDVRVMPFDTAEKCAVARFRETSSFHQRQASQIGELQLWATSKKGRHCLQKLAAYLDLDIPIFDRPASKSRIALGYLAGFHVSSQGLIVKVDLGGSNLQTWKFPLALMSNFAASCDDLHGLVSLGSKEEETIAQLASLGRAFRARQSMYRFSLRQLTASPVHFPDCHYEVIQITLADPEALGFLYAACLQ